VTTDQLVQVILALIAGMPVTLAVILTARHQSSRSNIIEDKVDEVHKMANDRLTQSLEATQRALEEVTTLKLLIKSMQETKEDKP